MSGPTYIIDPKVKNPTKKASKYNVKNQPKT